MNATASVPGSTPTQILREMETRLVARLNEAIDQWSLGTSQLTHWEVEHLAGESRSEDLVRHREAVERLLRLGGLFVYVVEQPEYSDAARRAEVHATLRCLRDKIALWHSPSMDRSEAERLLAEAFPGES